jgi:acetyltransferase-like isoleucine patch superfamily enzyme
VELPFTADYGYNTTMSPGVYLNYGCIILDTCQVAIGARTLLGPNVRLFAAAHPLSAKARDGMCGPEYGAPITIEEDCWLAGNVAVLPGVRIGCGSTVGAGSVVTKDVPPGCVVAGNPARVIRVIEEDVVERFPRAGGRKALEIPEPDAPAAREDDLEVLMRRLQRLEAEVGEVKDELKRRMA